MRLQNYITEAEKFKEFNTDEELASFIKKNCSQYLKLLKGKKPLYRGIKNVAGVPFGYTIMIKDVRQNRRPRGVLTDVEFNWFNQHLKANGHISRTEAVMANSVKSNTTTFGESFMFFPVGKFNYTWVEATDFNYQDVRTKWDYNLALDTVGIPYQRDRQTTEQQDTVDNAMIYFHTNEGFDKMYQKGYEIWFDCLKYIVIQEFQYDFLKDLL